MHELLINGIVCASIVAFTFLFLSKIGAIEWLQIRGGLIGQLAGCVFCSCFWLSVIVTVSMLIFGRFGFDLGLLVIITVSTTISRILI